MRKFMKELKIWSVLIVIIIIAGCAVKAPVNQNDNHISTELSYNTDESNEVENEDPLVEVELIPPNPPVEYEPAWPERTIKSSDGYLVNTCVSKELRSKATTLTTSDGVYLSALVIGSGEKGVLLAHEQGYNICSFIDIGTELADSGYLVVIPEYRNHGASQNIGGDNEMIDRDAEAALSELKRLGAQKVFLAGASCGGTTAMIKGVAQELPIEGLMILSSPAKCGRHDAISSVSKITAPSLFVFSPGDYGGGIEREVRQLYEASGATDKELLILEEHGLHGTDMYRRGEQGDSLKSLLIDFVKSKFK